jgi:hypothetical protein
MTHAAARPQLEPGTPVKLKNGAEIGIVSVSDDWFDTLRIRGVSATAQVLVEWRINGRPTRIWERVSTLEQAPAAAPATLQAVRA